MAEYNPSKIIKDGNTYNFRDTTKIPLAGSNAISGSLIPSTDNSIDIGSSTNNIKMLYTKSITIDGTQFLPSDYFPKSGGAITGTKITRSQNNDHIEITGGADFVSGPSLILTPYNSIEGWKPQGTFVLHTNNHNLIGYSNGTLTWDGQSIQTTSDQRYKQQISNIDDKLLDAWQDVDLVQFKYNDAVEEKGNTARLHTGYVVQQIDDACKKHNVDVSKYGLYCHEEYAEETREVENEDGTKTTEVVRPASEHYSLRYTEVYAVECMYLRRCIARLTARIEELEKGNNTK